MFHKRECAIFCTGLCLSTFLGRSAGDLDEMVALDAVLRGGV